MAGPRGLEPLTPSSAGYSEDRLLEGFAEFLRVDLRLQPRSVKNHVSNAREFMRFVNKPLDQISAEDVRAYLKTRVDGNIYTYANKVKTLRRLLGSYLGYGWVRGFKIPKGYFKPKILPSREELKRFYYGLPEGRFRALFLVLASSGLRLGEVLSLTRGDVDLERRLILPKPHQGVSKRSWVACINEEAAEALRRYLSGYSGERLFRCDRHRISKVFRKVSEAIGVKITPQTLREWFCNEMARLGVADRFIDAFCGRTPKSVLARYYTDYSPDRLKEIYDKAGLKILS